MQRIAPRLPALRERLRLCCEQAMQRVVLNLYNVLVNVQRRQFVGTGVVAQVGRAADHGSPGRHPPPEHGARMALESPYARIATVMHKELGQHLRPAANAKKLSVRA